MKNFKYLMLVGLLSVAGSSFAVPAEAPRWVDLKDKDGDVVKMDRQGTKVQVDRANTIGWGAQKMKVFYRVVFKNPIELPSGQKVDEERFEVNIGCSNLYKAYMVEKNWYLDGKHTNVFTFGKGRSVSTLITQNLPVYYILESGCPPFDPDAVEDGDQMPFSGK
jgi:hypothetical protein